MRIVFDIEANGLLQQATKMHCLVAKDIDTGKVYKFAPYDSEWNKVDLWDTDALSFLDTCTTLIAHNGIDFDLPLLKKLYDWEPAPDVEIYDTLVMSRHLNPDRPRVEGSKSGPHAVESWGLRLGRWKPDHDNWSTFSMEMLHRCTEDVEIQHKIYQELCKEADIVDPTKSIFDKKAYGPNKWHKSMYLEHESAKIMKVQELNGCYFDTEKAVGLLKTLDEYIEDIEEGILADVPWKPKQKGVSIYKPFKKNGEYTKATLDWYPELELSQNSFVSGPFSRIEWEGLNLGSDKQVKEWLDTLGWQPTQWNYSTHEFDEEGKPLRTSPKLTPDSFDSLPSGLGDKLKRRSMASHRRSQIAGWVGHVRDDHRIAAQANPQGTNTGRMKHRVVANVPKASADEETHELLYFPSPQPVFLGTEMRDLFRAAPGKVLVGRDAAGLELRCFAHYIDDPVYIDVILNGDIHTYNQEMAGLSTRDQAKTFIYAFLYGAGEAKLGAIVLPDASLAEQKAAGAALKEAFFRANPRLEKLIKAVKKASRRGWLRGLDGRKIMMRSKDGRIMENKALNTLLQCAGAVVMTEARVWLDQKIKERGLQDRAIKVLDYHDEETYECDPEVAEEVKELMIESVVQAGKTLKFNLPLGADARIGQTWAEIH